MEIILLIVVIILAFVSNNRTSTLRGDIERLEATIRALVERIGTAGVPAAAAATATGDAQAAQPTEMPPETSLRDAAVAEPAASPPPTGRPRLRPSRPSRRLPSTPTIFPRASATSRCRNPASSTAPSRRPRSRRRPSTAQPEAAPTGPNFSDLEKRFGTQWVVWVGGVALALGGILLVRYSIEQGLFGPGLRVAAGALLALVLVGLGELARRKENASDIDQMPRAHIPSILTAAGTTVAYADVWAAYELYKFLSPAMAFVLLGLVALGTLAAALKHGPALGGLGLVGAYVTPLLVSTTQPSYWTLYVYLTVVTAAAYALARFRMWRWLAITAAIFSILWTFVGMNDLRPGSLHAHAFSALAGFALAAVFLVPGLFYGPPETRGQVSPVASGVLAGYLVAAFALVMLTTHANTALITLFVLAAATAVIAWRSESAMLALPVAAALAVLVIVHWAVNFNFEILFTPRGPFYGAPPTWTITGRGQHLLFAAGTAAVFGGMGYWAQERSQRLEFSMLWAACAVLTPVVILIALYYSLASYGRSIPFAIMALALAALFALAALRLWQREEREGIREASAIFAVGAVAGLALALTFALEKGWLTVALALMVPGIALIADRQPMPVLRKLCAVVILLVMARIALDPRIVGADVGRTPIFNWLLWGYGVPALAFWFAGRVLRRHADDVPARMAEFGGDPVRRPHRHVRNPPPDERRRHLPAASEPGRGRIADLDLDRHGDRLRTSARAQWQHHPRCRRPRLRGVGVHRHRHRADVPREPAVHRRAGRRTVLQLRAARLRHSGGADGDPVARRPLHAAAALLLPLRRRRDRADARLSHAGGAHPVPRTGAQCAVHLGRGALHLLGGLAWLRGRAAAGRDRAEVATGAARLGGGGHPRHLQGVLHRLAGRAGPLPGAVDHLPRPGPDGHRMALSAPAVPGPKSNGARSGRRTERMNFDSTAGQLPAAAAWIGGCGGCDGCC